MLILSRKAGEAILIGDNIRVVIIASDRRGVRIGIEAPTDVGILREEIAVEVASENRRAGTSPAPAELLSLIRPAGAKDDDPHP